jgi:hypothetical protein
MKGSHPEGTDASALTHMLVGHDTLQSDRGLFLDETWRLHPEICVFTSELFYESRLHSRPGSELQIIKSTSRMGGSGLRSETIANWIRRGLEDDRNVARNRLKSFGLVRPDANQNVGPQRHEFSRQLREFRKVTAAVAYLDLQILAVAPAERTQIRFEQARWA